MSGYLTVIEPEGSRPTDETFSSSNYGTFNVSLIRRAVHKDEVPYTLHKFAINDSIRAANLSVDVNPERLKGLTYEAIKESVPMVVVDCEDGYHIQIDGSHRMRWLIENGHDFFAAVQVKLSDVRKYMIIFLESEDGENWKEVPYDTMAQMGFGKFPQHEPGKREIFDKAREEELNNEVGENE